MITTTFAKIAFLFQLYNFQKIVTHNLFSGLLRTIRTVNFKGSLSITVKDMSMVIYTPTVLRNFGVYSKEDFMELTTKCP